MSLSSMQQISIHMKGEMVKSPQNIFLTVGYFAGYLLGSVWKEQSGRYGKPAHRGLQMSDHQPSINPSGLRRKLSTFFTTHSPLQLAGAITRQGNPTNPSAVATTTFPSERPPKWSYTSRPKSDLTPLRSFHLEFGFGAFDDRRKSMTRVSRDYDTHSQLILLQLLIEVGPTRKGLTSNPRSMWHLPPSYKLENLHEIQNPINIKNPISPGNTSFSGKQGTKTDPHWWDIKTKWNSIWVNLLK